VRGTKGLWIGAKRKRGVAVGKRPGREQILEKTVQCKRGGSENLFQHQGSEPEAGGLSKNILGGSDKGFLKERGLIKQNGRRNPECAT